MEAWSANPRPRWEIQLNMSLLQDQLRLVCPSGGCASVEDFSKCTLGRVPSGALVVPADMFGSQLGSAIQNALVQKSQNATFFEQARQYVFASAAVGVQVSQIG